MEIFPIKPIHNDSDYQLVMNHMQTLWSSPDNSLEADLLDVLSLLVEQYEKKHYAIEPLDPIDAIRYEMDEKGLSQKDIAKYFGGKERVSEVLNRKRPLTLKMIKKLYHEMGISASSLLAY